MKKIFIKLSHLNEEIKNKITSLGIGDFVSLPEADIVVSDDLTIIKEAKKETIKLFVSEEQGIVIDNFYKTLADVQINGFITKSYNLIEDISGELIKVTGDVIKRGLAEYSSQKTPVFFDAILSTEKIGKKVDDIYHFTAGKIKEEIIRNLITAQLMLARFFSSKDALGKIDLEFLLEENVFHLSTLTRVNDCTSEKILIYIKENRSTARNLFEDSSFVSITYTEDDLRITTIKNNEENYSKGFSIFPSTTKEDNIIDEMGMDKKNNLNYINFSKIQELIKENKINSKDEFLEQEEEDFFLKNKDDNIKAETLSLISGSNEIASKMSDIIKQNINNHNLIKDLEKMHRQQEIMNQRFQALGGNIDLLREENFVLKQKLSEEKLRATQNNNLTLKNEENINDLKKELDKLYKRKKLLESEINNVSSKRESQDKEVRSMLMSFKLSEAEKIKLERAVLYLEKRANSAKEIEREVNEKNYELTQESNEHKKSIGILEQKIKRDEVLIKKLEEKKKENEMNLTNYIHIERELKLENKNLIMELTSKDKKLAALFREVENIKDVTGENGNKHNFQINYENKNEKDVKKLEMKLNNSENQIKIFLTTIKKLEGNEKKLKAEVRDFISEINKKDIQTDKLKRDIARLGLEIENLKLEKANERGSVEDTSIVSDINEQHEQFKKELIARERKFELEKQKLQAQIINMKKAHDSLERQLQGLRENINDLSRKYTQELNNSRKKESRIRELETEIKKAV